MLPAAVNVARTTIDRFRRRRRWRRHGPALMDPPSTAGAAMTTLWTAGPWLRRRPAPGGSTRRA